MKRRQFFTALGALFAMPFLSRFLPMVDPVRDDQWTPAEIKELEGCEPLAFNRIPSTHAADAYAYSIHGLRGTAEVQYELNKCRSVVLGRTIGPRPRFDDKNYGVITFNSMKIHSH